MPIIGSGDIASVLVDRADRLYFASGVSNSQCTDESEYQRELNLLLEQPRTAHIVYFSSLVVFSSETRYARHKRDMETTVKINFPKNTIMRVGNIAWGDNPHTIINYLKYRIQNNRRYEVQNTYRHVIDVDEFLYWVDKIPAWSCELNVPGRMMKVQEIVDAIKRREL